MDILIATHNRDKVREIKRIFSLPELIWHTLDEYPDCPKVVEDGNTLFENAYKKARMIAEFTGLPTIADDTGLEVDALHGQPGVFSARFAGENATYAQNVAKLLEVMRDIPDSERQAHFRCVAVYYSPDLTLVEEGKIDGIILRQPRGNGGFGYDPVFYLPQLGRTFAEMDLSEKNSLSHRGQAFTRLANKLKSVDKFVTDNI
ncbi:MAG: RdgB/HAM1 family non-canonical purine NTP pyrophosphatase [Candidatus Marinimicrobia bacterium]|jgi:XTP/dITP diphosphohydrolase|nr:RdgB/HAM1 family non-canonical purine NTP pyrophosphatase [Candidatus Neomarinimicrobiota bacterium]OQC47234.1 MAG: dITP/XTP pyrophosphatase [Candidatus Marinimicrobia bacterium ADurb.Bin030]MBP9005552.1 RdgB/HAM1 family non-canonical purine NTP pyrophosphatase [Candidatus Neomarinimicrobiota bacterium]HNZ36283.1 RdgB/HAM1 family non-canonical purine NTP pyrophosphatase [Candidatus Neomarinimicrobiota bacterium]HOD37912.1 RdgB/HAM1 family non-canonical purine NTP pyrophosphatase [Candidatus 